jgi:hypothetical protein
MYSVSEATAAARVSKCSWSSSSARAVVKKLSATALS